MTARRMRQVSSAGVPHILTAHRGAPIHGIAAMSRRCDDAVTSSALTATMDTPEPTHSSSSSPSIAARHLPIAIDRQVAWQALLMQMTELHARLEYLRVMLKLGVRGF